MAHAEGRWRLGRDMPLTPQTQGHEPLSLDIPTLDSPAKTA